MCRHASSVSALFLLNNCQKTKKNLVETKSCSTFAASYREEGIKVLSYGVMVAQQVLVLFVVVRIRLGQPITKASEEFF